MGTLGHFFKTRKGYGLFLLRLVAGWRLVLGVWDYAVRVKPISEVTGYFEQLQLPLPELGAYASVYAQFLCGLLFILGLWVRPAAIIMIINFSVAIIAAHLNDPVTVSFPAWALLAISCCLLLEGPGRFSFSASA